VLRRFQEDYIFLESVYQLKIALNNLLLIASSKLLLISVPKCHSHGILEQSNKSPARFSKYYTARIGGFNTLKF